jgi:1-acyl-sn-glycerol-3-phosphate acyltransferase
MVAQGVFRTLFGVSGLVLGPIGAFAVDMTPGKGGPAKVAAVQVLKTGQILSMAPEGRNPLDDRPTGPFKPGAVNIGKQAAAELRRTVYFVPIFVRYGRYAPTWISELPGGLRYVVVFFNPWYFRRGATVVIGKAMPSTELSEDDLQASEQLRQHVISFDPLRRKGDQVKETKGGS